MVLEINSKNLHMKRVKKINKYLPSLLNPLPTTTTTHPQVLQPFQFFFSSFPFFLNSNNMLMTYYCAYLRKIAWPQVNLREAKDNSACVKLSYHLFPNVIWVRHYYNFFFLSRRGEDAAAVVGRGGRGGSGEKKSGQIILLMCFEWLSSLRAWSTESTWLRIP